MGQADQRIVQLVVFVGILHRGLVEGHPLREAVALAEAPGGDVADDDLQGHDLHPLHQRLPLTELLHKMGGDPRLFQAAHEAVAHAVVDDALSNDGAFLFSVEGGGVVLVGHDQFLGIVGGVDLLCLALI